MTTQDNTSTTKTCSLAIKFTSDWHVGEGAGRPGNIDRIIRRHPEDDLPYIPAKTLIGIWRDACEQIAVGLDGATFLNHEEPAGWQGLLHAVFGDQPNQRDKTFNRIRKSQLTVRPAIFDKALRQILCEPKNGDLKDALTFTKPGVKIDETTGQAKDDCLRFEEIARGRAELAAEVSLNESLKGIQQQAALALLWAGAKVAERLGGKRRRGLGRCKWSFDGIDKATALKLLDGDAPTVGETCNKCERDPHNSDDPVANNGEKWVRIPITLTPLIPLVIPKQVTGNVVECLDYIPGTQLLAAFSSSLRSVIKGVVNGDVRVLNAYPVVQEQHNKQWEPVRGRPLPFVLFHDKLEEGLTASKRKKDADGNDIPLVWNRMQEKDRKDLQLKQHRNGVVGSFPLHHHQLPAYNKVDIQVTTHGAIDDLPQRPTSAVGGVYSYQAIPAARTLYDADHQEWTAGQFQTEIWIKSGSLTDAIKSISLPKEIKIGIAKKDDYGRVGVEIGKAEQHDPALNTIKLKGVEDKNAFTLWCHSTVLLRDRALRSVSGVKLLEAELSKRLGVRVEACESDPDDHKIEAALRTDRTEGWLERWQLPRPSFVGIAAGSCVRFKVTEGDTNTLLDELKKLQQRGLGERRGEGFGEVCFNDPLLEATLNNHAPSPQRKAEPHTSGAKAALIKENEAGFTFAQQLEEATWRKSIDTLANAFAIKQVETKLHWCTKNSKSDPPNSQLSALRSIASTLKNEKDLDLDRVIKWIDHLEDTENRKKKWPPDSLSILRKLFAKPILIWEWLRSLIDTDARHPFPIITQSKKVDGDRKTELETQLLMTAIRTVLIASIQTTTKLREKASAETKNQQSQLTGGA